MTEAYAHASVLQREVLDVLDVGAGKLYCDATLGGGGHTQAILERSAPDGRVLGIDQDPEALEHCAIALRAYGDRLVLRHGNFGDLLAIVEQAACGPLDGLLVDLGVSSHQLDSARRGFSFSAAGPLDMRMDPSSPTTAATLLAELDEAALARLLFELGEEPAARRIARAIKRAWPLQTTTELAEVVAAAAPRRRGEHTHPATRTFMALRLAVNDELGVLRRFLDDMPRTLRAGGRVAVIAFHSLEDRIVKQHLASLCHPCICPPGLPRCACGRQASFEPVTRKAVKAGDDEVSHNPRARSARLRAARRLGTWHAPLGPSQ